MVDIDGQIARAKKLVDIYKGICSDHTDGLDDLAFALSPGGGVPGKKHTPVLLKKLTDVYNNIRRVHEIIDVAMKERCLTTSVKAYTDKKITLSSMFRNPDKLIPILEAVVTDLETIKKSIICIERALVTDDVISVSAEAITEVTPDDGTDPVLDPVADENITEQVEDAPVD